jgi:hypothetical protein
VQVPLTEAFPRKALDNALHGGSIRGPNGGDERRLIHLMPGLRQQQRRRYTFRREFSDKDGDRATAIITDLEKAESVNNKDYIYLVEKTVQRFQESIRLDCCSVGFVPFSTLPSEC